jgi:hypothetical protein
VQLKNSTYSFTLIFGLIKIGLYPTTLYPTAKEVHDFKLQADILDAVESNENSLLWLIVKKDFYLRLINYNLEKKMCLVGFRL